MAKPISISVGNRLAIDIEFKKALALKPSGMHTTDFIKQAVINQYLNQKKE